jgi:hypothetical protein
VTCNTGNKIQPKGESRKSQTKIFSDGDTHLMEALLSRRDTLFWRNSTIFRKIASGKQYGNQNSSPLASTPKQDLNLGQYSKMRFH